MKIYDLSVPIKQNMVVWPGQPKPKITVKTDGKADSASLTNFTLNSHNGTHVDAPKHFIKSGKTIDKVEAEKLVGNCKILDLTNFFKTGGPAEIGWAHFGGLKVKKGDRILIKTGNYKFLEGKKFTTDYISLSLDAAKNLVKKQISLIGIDYFGIEKKGNPGHPVHKMLLREGIIIVEGLNLKDVQKGEYTLVCAPLKLEGADASPARVFLIKE
ncbi:cyclase family protein [Candidatus Gottesmanbacteria bacterium]|nr:cyclase family protein [Candidatus Gottesmanbacteria bacterium]